MVGIYSIFITNKAGGLIYHREFLKVPGVDSLNTNDIMMLASTWHSLHAIAGQLSPMPADTGIEKLEADTFDLHCFTALTGTKFVMVVDRHTPDVDDLLATLVYDLYADYVLKNPFYEVEMPIRCELFDVNLAQTVTNVHRRLGLLV